NHFTSPGIDMESAVALARRRGFSRDRLRGSAGVSTGLKGSRNRQSEWSQVLRASSAGRRLELYSRLYRFQGSEPLRIESQTGRIASTVRRTRATIHAANRNKRSRGLR